MRLIVPEGGVDAIAMKYKINDWSDYRPYLGHYCYVKAPTPLSVTHTLEQSSCAPVLYSPCMGKVRRVHKKWCLKRYRKALFHLGVSDFLASSLFSLPFWVQLTPFSFPSWVQLSLFLIAILPSITIFGSSIADLVPPSKWFGPLFA